MERAGSHIDLTNLTFEPVTADRWYDFDTLFSGEPGVHRYCWCMYWRLKRAEFHRQGSQVLRSAMQAIVAADRVPGILAYWEGRPIGWCSVAPRDEFSTLDRSPTLQRVDDRPVWSIVCFFISEPSRQQGVAQALLQAAIQHARLNGAQILEAYPLLPDEGKDQRFEEYMGIVPMFESAGFTLAAARSRRRVVMRLPLAPPAGDADPV
jgi:GNAT superfamily N-acetyltransferase